MAKEKLEDLRWLRELHELLPVVQERHPEKLEELESEIAKIKHKIATHDYGPLEARRQASVSRLGKESVFF